MRRRKRMTAEELLQTPVAARAFEEEVLLGRTRSRISELLDKSGLKQQDLAAKLGVSAGRVSQFLSGAENMTLRTLAGIGHALGYRFELVTEPIDHPKDFETDDEHPVTFRAIADDKLSSGGEHAEGSQFAGVIRAGR